MCVLSEYSVFLLTSNPPLSLFWHKICFIQKHMLSSVSSANSSNVTALNTASLLAQVREARKASLATQGIRAVDPATNAVDPTYVKALYKDYVQFFLGDTSAKRVGLEEIENVLKDQLNAVLSLVSSKKTYDFPLDIAKILDENQLDKDQDKNNKDQDENKICKKGNEAYKFYVRKIVSALNDLHETLTSAKSNLSRLQTLIRREDFENPAVRELLTQLRLAEIDGEAIKKTFSEYMVPKNFDITYFDVYKYGDDEDPKYTQTAETAKSVAQGSEAYTMPEATEIDWEKEKEKEKGEDWETKILTFHSKIPDDISSVDDLRTKIKTEKLTGSRIVCTYYLKKGSTTELTDRYDTSADVYYVTKDTIEEKKTKNDEISFFGELPLLDKLKYIVLYYTKSGTRRTFPENDPVNGFPCLPNIAPTGINPATGQDRKYTDDTNEIARLEPFYIGFLVDRDGPVNALASFMEIKSLAIGEQIKILGYRIKALRHYLRFLHRGLEEVNKSQSDGDARIPNSAYEILAMVGSNPTRCLKTIDGKDYFVLQWNGNEGNATYHKSPNDKYMLVRANDEGIEEFIKYADVFYNGHPVNHISRCYNYFFDNSKGIQPKLQSICGDEQYKIAKDLMLGTGMISQDLWNRYGNREDWNLNIENHHYTIYDGDFAWTGRAWWDDNGSVSDADKELPAGWLSNPHKRGVNSSLMRIITETDESKLPRELETNRMNITSATDKTFAEGMKWNYYNSGSEYAKYIWPNVLETFTTVYNTVIGNVQSQLESVEKSIESLRNKINTFDTSAANFRNKAYTIYNKTVNNIE